MRGYCIAGVLIVVLAGYGFSEPRTHAQTAAKKQTVEDKAQRARGAADADPNVKTNQGLNDPAQKSPAPPHKGGTQTRGVRVCAITFDNWTGWRVETYVDGEYWGTVPRWGDLQTFAVAGKTTVYAKVRFTDGSWKYWGPRVFTCEADESYTWKLGE